MSKIGLPNCLSSIQFCAQPCECGDLDDPLDLWLGPTHPQLGRWVSRFTRTWTLVRSRLFWKQIFQTGKGLLGWAGYVSIHTLSLAQCFIGMCTNGFIFFLHKKVVCKVLKTIFWDSSKFDMNMKDNRSCLVSLSRLTVILDWHFCCLKEFGLMGKLPWMEYNSPRSQDQGRMWLIYYIIIRDNCFCKMTSAVILSKLNHEIAPSKIV